MSTVLRDDFERNSDEHNTGKDDGDGEVGKGKGKGKELPSHDHSPGIVSHNDSECNENLLNSENDNDGNDEEVVKGKGKGKEKELPGHTPATPRKGSGIRMSLLDNVKGTPQNRGTSSQDREVSQSSFRYHRRPYIQEDFATSRICVSFNQFLNFICPHNECEQFERFTSNIQKSKRYANYRNQYAEAYTTAMKSGSNNKEKHLYKPYIQLTNRINKLACEALGIPQSQRTRLYVQDSAMLPWAKNSLKPDCGEVLESLWESSPKNSTAPKFAWPQLVGFREIKFSARHLDDGIDAKVLCDEGRDPRFVYSRKLDGVIAPRAEADKNPTVKSEIIDELNTPGGSTSGPKRGRPDDSADDSESSESIPDAKRPKLNPSSNDPSDPGGSASSTYLEAPLDPAPPDWTTTCQMANYAMSILSQAPLRTHTIGALVCGKHIQYVYYDRSVIVVAEPINFIENESDFLKSIFALARLTLSQRGIPDWFSDPYVLDYNNFFSSLAAKNLDYILDGLSVNVHQVVDEENVEVEVKFGKILNRSTSIIGRGTIVVEVKSDELADGTHIVKISHPVKSRTSEVEFIKNFEEMARDTRNPQPLNHLPTLFASADFECAEDSAAHRLARELRVDDDNIGWLGHKFIYGERVTRCIVQERLYPIKELEVEEIAQALFDIVLVYGWAVIIAKIIHRDLSIRNLMYRRKNMKIYGVLNDWDLSSYLKDIGQPSSPQRTGTRLYMALELLRSSPPEHLPLHDLESLVYILLHLGNATGLEMEMDRWAQLEDAPLMGIKYRFLMTSGTFYLNKFLHLKDWIVELRNFFRQGLIMQMVHNEMGVFDNKTLGGIVTIDTFISVMGTLNGKELIKNITYPYIGCQ